MLPRGNPSWIPKKQALAHFMRMTRHAKTRTQKAKAWYWVGRTREALGDLAGARRAYAESARTPTVYYGLLSREKIGLGRKPIPIRKGVPTAKARRDVAAHRFGRAVRLLGRAGGEWHVSAFIWPMARAWNDRAHLAAAAALLWDAGGPAMAVKLAKAAGARGIDIDNYGYPVKALPRFRHLGPPLEEPVLLGLIRQESEFNARAGSHAGAKGLMQLMPGTARIEARLLKVPYRRAWLISRPEYNLMLGRHHLSQLVRKFSGSYVLGFAAYNAGSGNVRKWLKAYGDFRTGHPDPVEWVELIPITETRKYVQKVLRGVHVYRTRLGRPMLPMSRDLWRGVPELLKSSLPSREIFSLGVQQDDFASRIGNADTVFLQCVPYEEQHVRGELVGAVVEAVHPEFHGELHPAAAESPQFAVGLFRGVQNSGVA